MDPRLLRHYETELRYLREMGAEFARDFPKIAGRLGLPRDGTTDVADPYVERLLEGSAFLAARVQLRIDEEFPRFTQRMMQTLMPQAIAPTPSMLVAQFQPDLSNPNLAKGFVLARGAALTSKEAIGTRTACQFRTGAALTLWPLELTEAAWLPRAADLPLAGVPALAPLVTRVRGVLRLRLAVPEGLSIDALKLDTLSLFFSGDETPAWRLHEAVLSHALAITVSAPSRPLKHLFTLPASALSHPGFDDDEALLPATAQGLRGYRHVREYFAFPQRFRFVRIDGLGRALPHIAGREVELNILLGRSDALLEHAVSREHVLLNCVTAVNLFARQADRALVSDQSVDFHVVPDRSRPLDFEVHSVTGVRGYSGGSGEQVFSPFYAAFHDTRGEDTAWFTTERLPRAPRGPDTVRRAGGIDTGYVASEVYVSIVDARHAPWPRSLRQLAFETLCTNRDLPMSIPLGGARGDFTLDVAAPVTAIRRISGPSQPIPAVLEVQDGWRLIDHLSLNYLSLLDANPEQGAAALRAMLMLYVAPADNEAAAHAGGVRSVRAQPVVRRLALPGPITFARGLAIDLTFDAAAFAGAGAHVLARVLDSFFARYVSINSFVQTTVRDIDGRTLHAGVPRCGARATI
ncbi:type VI secretion system baseplate subunit TssF [Caballeronia sp. BR00000012568055]|uniref:type VI secretion system baseplate subunit TssF n=1 Tax=Caballeronia sp. BR00000012568055 TaxID=2918761 RepID=UPI0023F94692|nr:type VI secretion system baseplate subunit TssF [Caballeronia sp. BR00000012568055]